MTLFLIFLIIFAVSFIVVLAILVIGDRDADPLLSDTSTCKCKRKSKPDGCSKTKQGAK